MKNARKHQGYPISKPIAHGTLLADFWLEPRESLRTVKTSEGRGRGEGGEGGLNESNERFARRDGDDLFEGRNAYPRTTGVRAIFQLLFTISLSLSLFSPRIEREKQPEKRRQGKKRRKESYRERLLSVAVDRGRQWRLGPPCT